LRSPQHCAGPVQSPVASSIAISTPKRSSKARQVASVSGKSTPVSIVKKRASGSILSSMSMITEASFWKEHATTRRGWWRSTAKRSTSSAEWLSRSGATATAMAIPRTRLRRG
jgi:hypothetical protein